MKPLTISIVVALAGGVGFAVGYRLAARGSAEKPSYVAVSLVGDRFLHAVSTVVQDEEGHYVMKGDQIRFFSDSSTTDGSALRPFALEFQRWDYFSSKEPKGALALVRISERTKEETFIVREGKAVRVDPIARTHPGKERANQSPQRNAGSRPSSGDSPAPETPSSLGPRG